MCSHAGARAVCRVIPAVRSHRDKTARICAVNHSEKAQEAR